MAQQQKKKKSFSVHDFYNIRPKTDNQQIVFENFENFSSIALLGAPGCGKTFLAFYLSLKEVLDRDSPYEKIVVIKSAVQSRDQGYLPGDTDEKQKPYFDYLEDIASDIFKYKSNNFKNLVEIGLVECQTTSFLRGVNYSNSIVIVDECQNMNFTEQHTIYTRLDLDSKIVLVGDINQNDLQNKRGEQSGFVKFFNILESIDHHMTVHFDVNDIVRSSLVKEYIKAGINLGYF